MILKEMLLFLSLSNPVLQYVVCVNTNSKIVLAKKRTYTVEPDLIATEMLAFPSNSSKNKMVTIP